jgi:adenylate cyclase
MLFRKTTNAHAPRIGAPKETTSLALCIVIALAWSVVLALLSFTARWQDHVEARGFDELTFVTAPSASKFPITIVGIDEASFHQLGLQWPWPRSVHADLIDRLSKAGAAVIVLDVVFSEPSSPKEDLRLADAIKHAGNVVLAADRYYDETGGVRQWLRLDPAQIFLDAGAQTGLASVTLDRDTALRSMPDSQDAMWRAIIRRLMMQHAEIGPNLAIRPGSLIHYAGPDHTFPYVSYHEVVKPTGSIPADFFKDQIVIVGRDIRAAADVGSAQADMFRTPFTSRDSKLMPGAEVHANILETVLAGQAVTPVPPAAVVVLLTLVALGCALLMRRWRPVLSAALGVAVMAALLLLDWSLFASLQIWLPAASTLSVAPAMYVSLGGVSFLREQARKREVTQAFSLYVTPQVVDSLLANPDKLKLGGERREITFMFTDLAGFTTFSEALSAERTVYLLNRHFTDMTDIVLKHGGTVSRFIGDAIMAFWGAPLDDDKQALNAV